MTKKECGLAMTKKERGLAMTSGSGLAMT